MKPKGFDLSVIIASGNISTKGETFMNAIRPGDAG